MLRITGYSDCYSIRPGDDITFYVNSEKGEDYEAKLVRLIHGDTPRRARLQGTRDRRALRRQPRGRNQKIHGGSYVIVPHDARMSISSFTIQAFIFPTTPTKGRQGILTKWVNDTGYGLFVDDDGCLALCIGDGKTVRTISSGKKLLRKVWYLAAASYDAESGAVCLYQEPVVTSANGGLGMALLHPAEETTAEVSGSCDVAPGANDAPFLMAAATAVSNSGRSICGAHYKEAASPVALPEQCDTYNGKIDRPRLSAAALGKHEIDALARGFKGCPADLRRIVIGAWDFQANMTKNIASTYIIDTSPNVLNGHAINLPARGMTGYNWTGDEIVYHHAPEEYGAVHFHNDDIDDARWDADFTFTAPEGLKSGFYAARLRIGGEESSATEDYIPFVVRPPKDQPSARVAVIIPTNSYLAYSNDNLATNSVVAQLLAGKVPLMQASDLYLNEHREYGLSTYSLHSDGSGVCYSSRLRPILNMRPKYRHWLSPSLWQLNGDLHLTDWLEAVGFDYDLHSDEDSGPRGRGAAQPVPRRAHRLASGILIRGHDRRLRGLPAAGRPLALSGRRRVLLVQPVPPDNGNIIEVRKGEAGTRAWTANPGEYNNAFDGKFGGMWRARGRIPSKVCGLTFTAYGFDVSSYYKREADSFRTECEWIFEGIGDDEVIGDFGLVGGGAAGLELDRYDLEFGTPHNGYLLARSEGHTDLMLQVNEEIHFACRGYYGGGHENPQVRADMIYYKTPKGGAVFGPGSLVWCGSLSHNNYDNNVSRILENVINGFLKDGPLP